MNGKETLRLLDFVNELRRERELLEAEAAGAVDKRPVLNAKTAVLGDVSSKLEKLLRELNA